jgi:hypothetical protein
MVGYRIVREVAMAPHSSEITSSKAGIVLEDLLGLIRRLDEPSRARVAQALADVEMDARLRDLIDQLASRAPADDITDADIDAEIRAVRDAARPT